MWLVPLVRSASPRAPAGRRVERDPDPRRAGERPDDPDEGDRPVHPPRPLEARAEVEDLGDRAVGVGEPGDRGSACCADSAARPRPGSRPRSATRRAAARSRLSARAASRTADRRRPAARSPRRSRPARSTSALTWQLPIGQSDRSAIRRRLQPGASPSATPSSRQRAALGRAGPTSTPAPPSAAAARNASSSVRSSPTNTGRAPANAGSAISAPKRVALVGAGRAKLGHHLAALERPGRAAPASASMKASAASRPLRARAGNGARRRPACPRPAGPRPPAAKRRTRSRASSSPSGTRAAAGVPSASRSSSPCEPEQRCRAAAEMALEIGDRAAADDGEPPVEPAPTAARAAAPARAGPRSHPGVSASSTRVPSKSRNSAAGASRDSGGGGESGMTCVGNMASKSQPLSSLFMQR